MKQMTETYSYSGGEFKNPIFIKFYILQFYISI